MKKNRLLLLAALPLLASCRGEIKEVEQPNIQFSYTAEVTFADFKDKVATAKENFEWGKEDFKAPSFKMSSVDYSKSYEKDEETGRVTLEDNSVYGSKSNGGYDASKHVLFGETVSTSKRDKVSLDEEYHSENKSESTSGAQAVYFVNGVKPTSVYFDVEKRTYIQYPNDMNKIAISSATSAVEYSDINDILHDYEDITDEEEKAKWHFYVDGTTFTATYFSEETVESKTGDVIDQRDYEKHDRIYQVELSSSKIVNRQVVKQAYWSEGLTDDSTVGKGVREEWSYDVYKESICEVGAYEHDLVDISSFEKTV